MLESSTAAQCPSVAYQLAGAKKVQQDLAAPGVVERFVDSQEEAALIRDCFAGTVNTQCLVIECSVSGPNRMLLLWTQHLQPST